MSLLRNDREGLTMLRDDGTNCYDQLPAGVKLHVLSFLASQDFTAAVSLNRKNRALIQHDAQPVIKQLLEKQFRCIEYLGFDPYNLLIEFNRESRVIVAYLGAQDCLRQAGHKRRGLEKEAGQTEKNLIELDRIGLLVGLRTLPYHKMLATADLMIKKYVLYSGSQDRRCLFVKLYADLITSADAGGEMLRKLFRRMQYIAPEAMDEEMVAIQSMGGVFSRCGSLVSMQFLYHKLSQGMQREFLKKYGKILCSDAITYQRPAMLQVLLEWGVNPDCLSEVMKLKMAKLIKENSEGRYGNYKL